MIHEQYNEQSLQNEKDDTYDSDEIFSFALKEGLEEVSMSIEVQR
jgi:hypothetical protein